MKHIYNVVAGALISVSFAPGMSTGATSIIFGIYDRLVETLSFKKGTFKKNISFLITIIIGIVSGAWLFSSLTTSLIESYPVPTQFFFMGAILGCFPIAKQFYKSVSIKSKSIAFPFTVALALMIVLSFFQITERDTITNVGFLTSLALYGVSILCGIATFLPAVSGSVIMKLFGFNETVQYAKDHLFIGESLNASGIITMLAVTLGYLTGIILTAIVVFSLIKKCRNSFYSAVFGLMIGSLFVLFPTGFAFNFTGLYSIVCLACGVIFSYYIGEISRTDKPISTNNDDDFNEKKDGE